MKFKGLFVVLLLAGFATFQNGFGQSFDPSYMITNGEVECLVNDNDTIYVGGSFTKVSYSTGGFLPFSASTGDTLSGFPKICGGTGANMGTVRCIIKDGAGGWFIGGNIGCVNGVLVSNLAHIKSDLSVDSSWLPTVTGGEVYAMALSGGILYIGGNFSTVNGSPRDNLAAMDAITGSNLGLSKVFLATTSIVRSIAVGGSNVFVGGNFTSVDATTRRGIASINFSDVSSSGTVNTWDPGFTGGCPVSALSAQAVNAMILKDQNLYIAGSFDTIGGCVRRNNIAQVDTSTGMATSWRPWVSGTAPAASVNLTCMAMTPAGDFILAGGNFDSFNGNIVYTKAVKINLLDTGTLSIVTLSILTPGTTIGVNAIGVSGNKVFFGGSFTYVGGNQRDFLASCSLTTGLLNTFSPMPNDFIHAIAVSGDTVYVGGEFSGIKTIYRNRIFRFNGLTGAIDPNWKPDITAPANASVTAIAIAPNSVYIGGNFITVNGATRRKLVEVEKYGAGASTLWATDIATTTATIFVYALKLTPAFDTLFVGGNFLAAHPINGVGYNYLAALDPFSLTNIPWPQGTGPDGAVYSIQKKENLLYIGGAFNNVNGTPRRRMARLFTDQPAPSNLDLWNPGSGSSAANTTNAVFSLFLKSNGAIYAGGGFTNVQLKNYIAAFNTLDTGTVITAFNANANNAVRSIVGRFDSLVYIGGSFTTLSGNSFICNALLNDATGDPHPWAAPISFNPTGVCSTNAIMYSGTRTIIGGFYTCAGTSRSPATYLSGFSGTCLGTFFAAGSNQSICYGDSVQLETSGGDNWSWSPPSGLSTTADSAPMASPDSNQTYTITAISNDGCVNTDSVSVTVYQLPPSPSIMGSPTHCPGDSTSLCDSLTHPGYLWNTGDTSACIFASDTGWYSVSAISIEGCTSIPDSILVTELPSPPTPDAFANTDTSFVATDCSYSAYQWYFSSNPDTIPFGPIVGADSCGFQIPAGLSEGCFFVVATGATTCLTLPSDTICLLPPNGLEVVSNLGILTAFPNPFSDFSQVVLVPEKAGVFSFSVSDLMGRIITESNSGGIIPSGIPFYFPVPINKSGVYFIRVTSEEGAFNVLKLIKE